MKFQQPRTVSFVAAADFTGKKYHGIKLGANEGEVELAGAGEGLGVLMSEPQAGETAEMAMIGGGAMVHSGAAFAKGAELAVNAAGKFITALIGNRVLGIAMEAATAADEYREIERVYYIKA